MPVTPILPARRGSPRADNATMWLIAIYLNVIATVGGLAYWRFAELPSLGGPKRPRTVPATRTATDSGL